MDVRKNTRAASAKWRYSGQDDSLSVWVKCQMERINILSPIANSLSCDDVQIRFCKGQTAVWWKIPLPIQSRSIRTRARTNCSLVHLCSFSRDAKSSENDNEKQQTINKNNFRYYTRNDNNNGERRWEGGREITLTKYADNKCIELKINYQPRIFLLFDNQRGKPRKKEPNH